MAIEDMQKQIPKKPVTKKGKIVDCIGIDQYFTAEFCPTCEERLDSRRAYRSNHCECGQTIDWSECDD